MNKHRKLTQLIRYQYHLLLLAISFFTRVPIHLPADVKPEMLHQSSRYFALVGVFIGLVLALSLYGLEKLFPVEIAIIIVMAINVLLTGAFHEDGWADAWDGFGGGWTTTQKLNIMKDSRIGTYGAVALLLALMLKYQSMLALTYDLSLLLFLIVLANSISRTLATSLIFSIPYVTQDSESKVKPVATHLSLTSLIILILTSFFIVILGLYWQLITLIPVLIMISVLTLVYVILGRWFKRQIGGFTGDCLGAAQVISELVVYLLFVAFITNKEIFYV